MQTANTRYISGTFNFDKRRGTTLLSVGNNDLIINTRQVRKNTDSEGSRGDRRDDSRFQLNSNNDSLSPSLTSPVPGATPLQTKLAEATRETTRNRDRDRDKDREIERDREATSRRKRD